MDDIDKPAWRLLAFRRCVRRRWLLASCLACLAAAAVWFYSVNRRAWIAAWTSVCRGNFTMLGEQMARYQQYHGALPAAHIDAPNGQRMHSWRILMAQGYLDQAPTYHFREPWDSPNNARVGDFRPEFLACPSDPETQRNRRLTNYFVLEGQAITLLGEQKTSPTNARRDKGLANTIVVVEACGENIEWIEPRDLSVKRVARFLAQPKGESHTSGVSSESAPLARHPHGPFALMADGSVRSLAAASPEILKSLLEAHPEQSSEFVNLSQPPTMK